MEPTYSAAWFEAFGRPDEAQTEREVAFLLGALPPPPATVLDVACGFGRHARALAEKGYRTAGVENNAAVAAEARLAGVDVLVLDMRELRELPGSFDAVICMWASFGWFDDAANADVLAQLAEKTRPGGVVVLDVYDAVWFRAHQGVRAIDRGGRRAHEHKRVAGSRLLTTLDYGDGSHDVFEWRLYEPDELSALAAEHGLDRERVCAGFDPASAPAGETARMQLVFRRRSSDTPSRMDWDGLVANVTARHPVRESKMFGMPCLKRENGKVVAGYWKDGGLTVKLTDEAQREQALAIPGASAFDPGMGRAMREWVHVPAAQSGDWERLVEQAIG